jgi:hypothetical protein
MKHAGAAALQNLADLLDRIRTRDGIREKKHGVFYRKSKPFLHFHEDPAGMFADLAAGAGFDRYPINAEPEQIVLLAAIDRALSEAQPE